MHYSFLTAVLFSLISFGICLPQNATIDHWETVIYASDIWKYRTGNSEPSPDWKQLTYNDDDWSQGQGGIGYGDGDDNTAIQPTISHYLRIKFEITDTSKVLSGLLNVDYDDAFVAYINGVEIARAGISGSPPPYNQIANSNHEAQLHNGGIPAAFAIDKVILSQILNQNENLLVNIR